MGVSLGTKYYENDKKILLTEADVKENKSEKIEAAIVSSDRKNSSSSQTIHKSVKITGKAKGN